MKLLFASDIHGSANYTEQLCARIKEEKPDRIVLLGDLLYHGPRNALPPGYDPAAVATMLNKFSNLIIAVRGNCDSEVDQMVLDFPCMADYTTIALDDGRIVFATHGHLWDRDQLPKLATRSIVASGHTHIKIVEENEGVVFVNPGSVSIPKDGSRSYALYESSCFSLKTLEGENLKSFVLPL